MLEQKHDGLYCQCKACGKVEKHRPWTPGGGWVDPGHEMTHLCSCGHYADYGEE